MARDLQFACVTRVYTHRAAPAMACASGDLARVATRASVLIFIVRAALVRNGAADLLAWNTGAGAVTRGLHQNAPFTSVRTRRPAESSMNNQMGQLVAERFFQEREVIVAEQNRVDVDEIAPGLAQTERTTEAPVNANRAFKNFVCLPQMGPALEQRRYR